MFNFTPEEVESNGLVQPPTIDEIAMVILSPQRIGL